MRLIAIILLVLILVNCEKKKDKFPPFAAGLLAVSATSTVSGEDAAIAADKAALAISYSGNDTASSVTQNITLPTSGASGTTITWASNNTSAITTNGTVTRSIYSDTVVTLTATISKGGKSDNKTFSLTVTKRDGALTSSIRVFGQNGSFTSTTANNGGISANSLSNPIGIDQDLTGLYIADSGNNRVLFFANGSATATRVYGQGGSFTSNTANNGGVSANSLSNPIGVSVDLTGIYIADTGNHRVLYFPGTSTTATRVYGQAGSFTANTVNNGGITATSMNTPFSTALDSTGVYIADTQNHRVLWYSGTSTTATRVYGQAGSFTSNGSATTATGLWGPNSIALDSTGVYICEGIGNHRISYYSGTSTTATRVYGQAGSFTANTANNGGVSSNSLSNPNGLAVDSTGVFVGDFVNNRVLWYSGTSTTATRVYGQLGSFTSGTANNGGASSNSISGARGVKSFSDGIYISDSNNNRVLVY